MIAFIVYYSTCCGAETEIKGGEDFLNSKKEITMYYFCLKCGKPCDVTDQKPKHDKKLSQRHIFTQRRERKI